MSNRCIFSTSYYNYTTWLKIPYVCDEDALSSSSYCLFHDQSYWKDNPDRINERLTQKIEVGIPNNEVLLCVGYNLPSIKITKMINKEVYFNFAKFYDQAYFKGTTFDLVSFEGARFEGSAVFQDVTFRKADFKHAIFNDANFQGTVFGERDFAECQFLGKVLF